MRSGFEILHLFSTQKDFECEFFFIKNSTLTVKRKKLNRKKRIYELLAFVFLETAGADFKSTFDFINTMNIKRKDLDINKMIGICLTMQTFRSSSKTCCILEADQVKGIRS